MRILFAQSHPRDARLGSPKSVLCLGDALAGLGHTVDYLFGNDVPLIVPWEKLRFATFPVSLSRQLLSRDLVDRYDVIDIASGDAWLYAQRRPARRPVLVNRVLGLEHLYWREFLIQARRREVELSLQHRLWYGQVRLAQVEGSIKHSDHVICLCRADRDYIVEHRWKQAPHVSVTPPGADDVIAADGAQQGRRTGTKLLFVGTWHFRKGITTLVDAFTALHAQRPDVTLTVAGSNVPGEAVLRHFPASVQPNVTTCPPLAASELANLYHTHDIFVLPSLYEGFGMVFLEAMAAGMAVVGTETGGMPDLIEHGTDGFLIPRRDPAALRHTLTALLHDDALRVAVGERARSKAAQYMWERAARHTADVYQELVKRPHGRTMPLPARVVSP